MSTRTTLRPQVVIPSSQASPANTGAMTASITSAPTILGSLTMCSYAVSWTGTSPVGTISVQVSDDYQAQGATVIAAGTWNTVPLNLAGVQVTSIPLTGNSGNGFIDIDGISAYAIRLVYTYTSGTGAMIATINGKVS